MSANLRLSDFNRIFVRFDQARTGVKAVPIERR